MVDEYKNRDKQVTHVLYMFIGVHVFLLVVRTYKHNRCMPQQLGGAVSPRYAFAMPLFACE